MRLLPEAKQIVGGLTDTGLLVRGYDQAADNTRRFTQSLPRTILRTWAEGFPEDQREAIPPLAFLGGHPRSGTTLLEQVLDAHPGVAALDEPGTGKVLLDKNPSPTARLPLWLRVFPMRVLIALRDPRDVVLCCYF